MEPIRQADVQDALQPYVGAAVWLHLETTTGAYTEGAFGAFIRNAQVSLERATLQGTGPYRAGLQLAHGWIYAEGLTHWEQDPAGRLLLAGHDKEGRLTVALQLSHEPFPA